MTKSEFIKELEKRLSGLPQREVEERLSFYGEMIDDRIEEGRTEDEAISDMGGVDGISEQIIREIPLARIAKERIKPKRRMRAWEILLLALGSPIWLSLGVAALAVLLAVYAVLWSGIGSLWAVFGALCACALGGVAAGIGFAVYSKLLVGLVLVGAGLVCAGLSILLFFGCLAATKGIAWTTKKIALGIKKCFVRKEKTE